MNFSNLIEAGLQYVNHPLNAAQSNHIMWPAGFTQLGQFI